MRILSVVLMSLLVTGSSTGESFEAVIGGTASDRGVLARPIEDGGYVVVGVTASTGEGGDDVYLVRTDAKGQTLWTRTYGGAEDDAGWAVDETANGFLITGFTESFGSGGSDCYSVRTDREGKLLGSSTFGGEGDELCWAHIAMGEGGYLLVGETSNTGRGGEDCYVIKISASGEAQWTRTYGGSQGDRCFSVAAAGDGFILAGQTYSEGAGDRDAYLIKIDSLGEVQWSRTFGGAESDVAHSIVATADGDFLVTGYTTSFAETGDDPYLIKIDSSGEARWTRVLPVAGVSHTLTGDQGKDGGFFLTGFSVDRSAGSNHALLIKTDAAGGLEWMREILPTTRGQTFGYTVEATRDGGCVLAGHTTEGSAGDVDLLLVKVGADGR